MKNLGSDDDREQGLRRSLAHLLEHEAGKDSVTSAARAAAAGRLLDRLCEELGSVIGSLGVRALVLRAVALGRPRFPFLDGAGLGAVPPTESMGEPFRVCLEPEDPEVVTDAALTVFAAVVDLLVTAIGERLAWRLLRDVWPEALRPQAVARENEE